MDKKTKQKQVLLALVNKQLEPFNKTYDDVLGDNLWYTKYIVTQEQEIEFISWGTDYIQKSLRLTKKSAQLEMQWFILQWGLKSNKIVNGNISIETLIKNIKTKKNKK
jgi:hypothetical protein